MTSPVHPSSLPELVEAVRSTPRAIAVGGGTKARLGRVDEGITRVSTTKLSGIVEYEPSEFTFTARSGTPLREIVAELAERGQYLPFDPLFVQAGATLGGTVAAGLSGPGRVRYGGIRDFILGVRFVDGEGRLLRLGGKVVKNAAGFDLPKFFVGSAGRFGILAELSFKVFPRPSCSRTLRLEARDASVKRDLLTAAATGRWEFDALDAAVAEEAVFARLAGQPEALDALARDVLAHWSGVVMSDGEASSLWQNVNEFRWTHAGGTLVKVALTPAAVPDFASFVQGQSQARGWVTAAGNAGFISLPSGTMLPPLAWSAVTLRGAGPLWHGPQPRFEFMQAMKAALDPHHRFPRLDD